MNISKYLYATKIIRVPNYYYTEVPEKNVFTYYTLINSLSLNYFVKIYDFSVF